MSLDGNGNLDNWQGKPVVDWTPEEATPLTGDAAYRLRVDFEDENEWGDLFAQFLAQPDCDKVTAFLVGAWGEVATGSDAGPAVQALTGARHKLPNLISLFVGDIESEESEISWIQQSDLSPLLTAYPKLEHFGVRGGQGLSLGIPRHDHLKFLVIETGGLPASVVEEISKATLPNLKHLELYLGTDELAAALTADGGAPILEQLETLDLSLGTLGDEGVKALAACPAIAKLKKLDIHHHYAGEESVALLTALGIEVDFSDPQDEDEDDRYVAVSE